MKFFEMASKCAGPIERLWAYITLMFLLFMNPLNVFFKCHFLSKLFEADKTLKSFDFSVHDCPMLLQSDFEGKRFATFIAKKRF